MQFSLRELLQFMMFACGVLALAQLPFFIGWVLLILGLVVANILAPTRTLQQVVFGGVVGIVVAIFGLTVYVDIATVPPATVDPPASLFLFRASVVQTGALVGSTIGFVASKVGKKAVA